MPRTWTDAFGELHEGPTGLECLQSLLAAGELHHATYRNVGTLWEGLHLYRKAADGFRGYAHAGSISKMEAADLDAAYILLKQAGIGASFGSYGNG